jgi:hypothetical protein
MMIKNRKGDDPMNNETSIERSNLNGAAMENHALDDEFFQKRGKPQQSSQEIDLADYRAGQSLTLGDIKALPASQKIEVRRPKPREWFRTHAESIERVWLKEGDGINEVFLAHRSVVAELPNEFDEAYLVPCINTADRLFLWPIKCNESGQEFTEAALSHVGQAQSAWVRRQWVSKLKAHKIDVTDMDGAEPNWPENLSTRDLISKAFSGKIIASVDHPELKYARIGK